jgi:UDP-N-acetylglucosamine 2-epimerase (non-hydrolysing)
MKILVAAGARPNFVKIAPILRAFGSEAKGRIEPILVDTGQHYDNAMAAAFFSDLRIPPPHYSLRVGSASHAAQTAMILQRFEPVLAAERPALVLVVGDVNSTLACALTAAKLGIAVAHVEAGLRSFDRSMPEEINRVVTDALADLLFTTEQSANDNLAREGVAADRIHFVGNVMIDSLRWAEPLAQRSPVLDRVGVDGGPYALVTLHRPSNVDDPRQLAAILGALADLGNDLPVLFPVHPRTAARIGALDVAEGAAAPRRISLLEPVGYIDFLRLLSSAAVVLTDSGGITEEATCLGVPCLTLRANTERPVTTELGSNVLAGTDPTQLAGKVRGALQAGRKPVRLPPLWDGHAAERIARILVQRC